MTAATFAGSGRTPAAETTWPRKVVSQAKNSHLESLAYNFALRRRVRALPRLTRWPFEGPVVDHDIVEVCQGLLQVCQDPVDEGLERRDRVAQAEWHDKPFEVPHVGSEGGLPDIGLEHGNLVVALLEVEFGEDGIAGELVKGLFDKWEGVAIFPGHVIELPVVDAHTLGAVMLGGENDRCAGGGLRRADEATGEQFGDLGLDFGLLGGGKAVFLAAW